MYLNGKQLYNNISNSAPKQERLYNLTLKTKKDLINLPDISVIAPGSLITFSDSGDVYILDLNKKWRKIVIEKEEDEDTALSNEIVYDGGELN